MTSIAIKEKTWLKLNKLKEPGDTMDDVINRILGSYIPEDNNDESEVISDEEFNTLLDDLHADPNEFNGYLEKSRLSFSRKEIDQ